MELQRTLIKGIQLGLESQGTVVSRSKARDDKRPERVRKLAVQLPLERKNNGVDDHLDESSFSGAVDETEPKWT